MTWAAELRNVEGIWYLATPYSKYPAGMRQAHIDACKAAAWFVKNNIACFCPIAHTHPIAVHGEIAQANHDLWIRADKPFMDACAGLAIYMMPTWEIAFGVQYERREFERHGKPIVYIPHPIQDDPE